VAALACRRAPDAAGSDAGTAPAAASADAGEFTMAQLAAATRLDATVQRLMALASEYKTALSFDRGPRLSQHTDVVAKRLEEAVAAADESLAQIRDPRDRALAGPVVAAARRWPALLRETRAELLASPQPPTRAAGELAAADDEVARALDRYRAFRASWRIVDSPVEPEPALEYLRARRALEQEEAALGRELQREPSPSDAGALDAAHARDDIQKLASAARAAASKLDEHRRVSALRFVDAEERALQALVATSSGSALEEERGRRALEYQIAKVSALEAVAEYVRLTAAGGGSR
jgi:hypothetical protein